MNPSILQACRPAFQPVVDLRTGRPVGYEALIRHPVLTPKDLFALAADRGRLVQFDLYCAMLALWGRPETGLLFINLCPATVMAAAQRPIPFAALAPMVRGVVWELSEQAGWALDRDAARRVKAALGGTLALDDVGEGWSDLRRLPEIKPRWLKIGGGLVRGCAADADRELVTRCIVRMAKGLRARPVAEAVETAEDASAIRRLGCRYAQGYYFGKPEMRETISRRPLWLPDGLRLAP